MATTLLRALALAAAAAAAGGGSAGPVTHSWATPVFEDFLAPQSSAALRPRLAALAQDLQAQQPAGVQKSNVGGWQSAPLAFSPDEDPALAQLVEHILDAARWFVSDGLGDDMRRQRALITGEYRLEVASLWINVNRARDYNNAHVHTDSFLSGVYYVDAGPRPLSAGGDEDDGGSVLVLSDPRVQLQQFEYFDWYGMGVQRRIEPSAGKLVLFPSWLVHRVEPVPSSQEPAPDATAPGSASSRVEDSARRISVSFNLVLKPSDRPP